MGDAVKEQVDKEEAEKEEVENEEVLELTGPQIKFCNSVDQAREFLKHLKEKYKSAEDVFQVYPSIKNWDDAEGVKHR